MRTRHLIPALALGALLTAGSPAAADNVLTQAQDIVGGNANSMNKNVGHSLIESVNDFGQPSQEP